MWLGTTYKRFVVVVVVCKCKTYLPLGKWNTYDFLSFAKSRCPFSKQSSVIADTPSDGTLQRRYAYPPSIINKVIFKKNKTQALIHFIDIQISGLCGWLAITSMLGCHQPFYDGWFTLSPFDNWGIGFSIKSILPKFHGRFSTIIAMKEGEKNMWKGMFNGI